MCCVCATQESPGGDSQQKGQPTRGRPSVVREEFGGLESKAQSDPYRIRIRRNGSLGQVMAVLDLAVEAAADVLLIAPADVPAGLASVAEFGGVATIGVKLARRTDLGPGAAREADGDLGARSQNLVTRDFGTGKPRGAEVDIIAGCGACSCFGVAAAPDHTAASLDTRLVGNGWRSGGQRSCERDENCTHIELLKLRPSSVGHCRV